MNETMQSLIIDWIEIDPPRTSIELGRRVSAEEIREGSDIYLECHVRANPPIHRLVWIHNVNPNDRQFSCNIYINSIRS